MEKKYEWKLKSFAKDVDADDAVKELSTVESVYGALTPENILNFAKSSNTKLHSLFTWDDSEAAHQYRLSQARTIVNNVQVTTISDGEPRKISVYEIVVNNNGRSYKHIDNLTSNELDQIKIATVRSLNQLKNKLTLYNQFTPVVNKMEEALEVILTI